MKAIILAVLAMGFVSPGAWACSCPPFNLEAHTDRADEIYFAALQQAKVVPGKYGNLSYSQTKG